MNKEAILVAGLGFGDEGKGTTVDYLTRTHGAHTIVRYNGGAQAGHSVVTKDGRHHVFSQFGSGILVPGVQTHLSRFVVVDPKTMANEEEHLRQLGVIDTFARTTIDGDALIVTPYQKITNQLREIARGQNRHGSCGMGIGETIADFKRYSKGVLFAKDLRNSKLTREKLKFIRSKKIETVSSLNLPYHNSVNLKLANLGSDNLLESCVDFYLFFALKIANIVKSEYLAGVLKERTVIFEGAQGVLLDPVYGFRPYVTKTNCTLGNALHLLEESGYSGKIKRMGVLRAYATRHGNGPFPTENENLTRLLLDTHNPEGPWQGKFRVGYFDIAASRYAIKSINGVDEIILTNLDRLIGIDSLKVCTQYRNGAPVYKIFDKINSPADALKYVKFLEDQLEVPIMIVSFGPTAEDKMAIYPVL